MVFWTSEKVEGQKRERNKAMASLVRRRRNIFAKIDAKNIFARRQKKFLTNSKIETFGFLL